MSIAAVWYDSYTRDVERSQKLGLGSTKKYNEGVKIIPYNSFKWDLRHSVIDEFIHDNSELYLNPNGNI
jgi:hypothetical protein